MPKINKVEMAKEAGVGAAAGIGIATILRLPVFFMAADCYNPERGLATGYAIAGLMGGVIGALRNYNRQLKENRKKK